MLSSHRCAFRATRRISRLHRYDFDTHHQAFKQLGAGLDFFSFAMEPLSLLLWWGDLTAARAGFAKVPRSPIEHVTTRGDQW